MVVKSKRVRVSLDVTADVVVAKYYGGFEMESREFNIKLLSKRISEDFNGKSPSKVLNDIKKDLRKQVKQKYNEAVGESVMPFIKDEDKDDEFFDTDSDGVFKVISDYADTYEDVEGQIQYTFRAVRTDTGKTFGSQVLFRAGLRDLWGKDIMYENKGDEGCAYNYLLDVFVNKHKGFKRYAKDKESINLAISLPRPQHKEIYDEWKKLYWDDFHSESFENQFPTIIPDNECDEDDSWLKYHYDDLSNREYSAKDIEKGMTILELVRWCITAQVSLNVLTGDGHTYLNYNPKHFSLQTKAQVPSIVVVAKDNHAYFVEDKSIKRSIGQSNKIHSSLDGLVMKKKEKEVKERTEKKHLFVDDGIEQAPPTPQEIMNLTDTIYYNNKSSLNGLVNYLGIYHDFHPIHLNGSISSIKEAIYPNGLSIMTYEAKPDWMGIGKDIDESDLDKLYQEIPELKNRKNTSPFPTYTEIGTAIAKRLNIKTDSNLNGMMRKIFYENEIKPEIRSFHNEDWIQGFKEEWDVKSFDIERAYSNALKDIQPCYFDSLTQPQKYYAGTFCADYFYLCKNKKDDYPCRGKGLVLYHGSMLELMMDYVEIKYVIKPAQHTKTPLFKKHNQLKGQEFVDECEAIEKACPSISAKKLVNFWIGSLKKKEGIVGYSLYTDRSVEQVKEYLYKGYDVRPIKNRGHRGCIRLLSKPQHRECLSTGQPIRLAVIDYINSILYLMSQQAKECKFSLLGFKTDAMYVLCNPEIENNFEDDWNKENYPPIHLENEITLNDYYRSVGRVRNTTIGVKYVPNEWEQDIVIDKKWSLNQGKMLLRLMLNNGGCWFNGKGGRGKTELIKLLKEMVERNRRRKVLWRCVWKSLGYKNLWSREKDFEEQNPCSIRIYAPTNKACVNVGGKTFNKGLGLPVTSEDEEDEGVEIVEGYLGLIVDKFKGDLESKKQPLNLFVAEEISMIDAFKWDVMSYIKHRIPSIKFMLCGDIEHQLPPVGERRPLQNAFVVKEIANFMRITLNYNFRENSATDSIWEEVDEPEILMNRQSTDENGVFNICYCHTRRHQVIKEVQDTLLNPDVFKTKKTKEGHTDELKCVLGTPLLASKTNSELDIIKNDLWEYRGKMGEKICVANSKLDKMNCMDEKDFLNTFYSGYCITGHKCQGDTYNYDYVIHDYDWVDDKRWRYVVVSRSTDYKNKVKIRTRPLPKKI